MKRVKIVLSALLIIFNSVFATGCWNYREVDQFTIVAGVAVDKGEHSKYRITVEVAQITGGREAKTNSKLISMEGDTIFDAVRNEISLAGKRLYWSHAKVLIISKEIASEGIANIIDWYNRDAETRGDVHILVSMEETARQIFEASSQIEDIKSFELDNIIKNQVSLSKTPIIEIWDFSNLLSRKNLGAITPTVSIYKKNIVDCPLVYGTAIFKNGKMIGTIDGEETKSLLFVLNQIKGGVLINDEKQDEMLVTLEIFKSKTKIVPVVNGDNVEINITIKTITGIDEFNGNGNCLDEELIRRLEQKLEIALKNRIIKLVKKIQSDYEVDIFGFGAKIHEDMPKEWSKLEDSWEEEFKDLKINVNTKFNIKNSATLSKTLNIGE